MSDFYERIKQLRKSKGITQAMMGERIGMSQNNYGLLERGETDISVSRLIQIAKALEVSIKEILFPDEMALPSNAELEREIEILQREKDLALKEKEVQAQAHKFTLRAREKAIKLLVEFIHELSQEEKSLSIIQSFLKEFIEEEEDFEDYKTKPKV